MAEIVNFDVKKLVKSLVERTAQSEQELYQKLLHEIEQEKRKLEKMQKQLTYGYVWMAGLTLLLLILAASLMNNLA